MKIELYLDGNQVEINKDIDFVLNKQFTELTDLTSIIVDYSKTIKVPMTPHNNELFNYVYRIDRQVFASEDVITYDPTQRISMYMTYNGSMVMEGYALLNSVNLKEKEYEINLYGQLGKIFSDLKDKPLVGNTQGRPGWHKPQNGWSKNIKMNTESISQSFANDSHSLLWSSTDWTDFFGFAPQMLGDTDIINTDCYEEYGGNIMKFTDYINYVRGINYADHYVKDGFDLNQYDEMRTYTGRPYVYVDKIIQMVQAEINQGDYDGYSMVLDADWFNSDNPYYADMCYFPGTESIVDSGESNTGVVTWNNTERTLSFPQGYLPSTTAVSLDGYTYTTSGNVATISATGGGDVTATLTLNCDGIIVRDRITNVAQYLPGPTGIQWGYWRANSDWDNLRYAIRYIGIYDANDNLLNKLYLCADKITIVTASSSGMYHYDIGGVWNILKRIDVKNIVPNSTVWENTVVDNSYIDATQQYNFGNVVLKSSSFQFKMECDIINFNNGTLYQANVPESSFAPLLPWTGGYTRSCLKNWGIYGHSDWFNPIQSMTVTSNNYRSGSYWNINDILGNDFNPFTWLIDYVKMFRLFFDIDYDTKTITLKKGYFSNVTYKQVTVDYNKGMVIEPVVDKYHTVEFGYRKNECKKGTQYYKKYGVEYGDISIDTRMTINNDTLSLTPNDDLGVFIPTTLNCLYWNNLKTTDPIVAGNPLKTGKVITTLDNDGKIQYFPFFAFRISNITSDMFVTDDSPSQRATGEYCYLDHNAGWQSEVEETETVGHCDDCGYDGELINGTCPICGSQNISNITTTNVYYSKLLTQFPRFDNYMAKGIPVPGFLIPDFFIFWATFNIPSEVYNGSIGTTWTSYSIYTERWQKYLNEIFNVHNNKVTCYVRMSYPEFIHFKFNQLFVIDNVTFLVNKIIDFNPNSSEPTKVELIEVSDVTNLQ